MLTAPTTPVDLAGVTTFVAVAEARSFASPASGSA
jgi:hypothetical protein